MELATVSSSTECALLQAVPIEVVLVFGLSAQTHFCYLCRKLLRGAKEGPGGRHFSNRSGCRQHSAD